MANTQIHVKILLISNSAVVEFLTLGGGVQVRTTAIKMLCEGLQWSDPGTFTGSTLIESWHENATLEYVQRPSCNSTESSLVQTCLLIDQLKRDASRADVRCPRPWPVSSVTSRVWRRRRHVTSSPGRQRGTRLWAQAGWPASLSARALRYQSHYWTDGRRSSASTELFTQL